MQARPRVLPLKAAAPGLFDVEDTPNYGLVAFGRGCATCCMFFWVVVSGLGAATLFIVLAAGSGNDWYRSGVYCTGEGRSSLWDNSVSCDWDRCGPGYGEAQYDSARGCCVCIPEDGMPDGWWFALGGAAFLFLVHFALSMGDYYNLGLGVTSPEKLAAYHQTIRDVPPTCSVLVECSHEESSTSTDSDGSTRTTYYTVRTYVETAYINYSSWSDISTALTVERKSKRVNRTEINFVHKVVVDQPTATEVTNMKERLYDENRHRDSDITVTSHTENPINGRGGRHFTVVWESMWYHTWWASLLGALCLMTLPLMIMRRSSSASMDVVILQQISAGQDLPRQSQRLLPGSVNDDKQRMKYEKPGEFLSRSTLVWLQAQVLPDHAWFPVQRPYPEHPGQYPQQYPTPYPPGPQHYPPQYPPNPQPQYPQYPQHPQYPALQPPAPGTAATLQEQRPGEVGPYHVQPGQVPHPVPPAAQPTAVGHGESTQGKQAESRVRTDSGVPKATPQIIGTAGDVTYYSSTLHNHPMTMVASSAAIASDGTAVPGYTCSACHVQYLDAGPLYKCMTDDGFMVCPACMLVPQ